jgi:hypothetical protein
MRKKMVLPTVYSNVELIDLEESRPWIFKSWMGTLSCSDDYGRFAWNPRRMAMLTYPANPERQKSFEEDLNSLAAAGLILRYGPGDQFGCFPKFEDHNSMTKRTPSEYPDPPGFCPKPELELEQERKGESKVKPG